MAAINFVAIAGLIAMLLCYKPVCSFIRGKEAAYGGKNGSGKKESAVSYGAADAKTGFMIFIFLFAVALLIRLIAAAIYKGNETDMNCFLLWSQSVFTDGLKKFYLSDSFHDYPPGYMYILYVVGAIRALFSWAWDSTASIVLTKMPAIIADMVTGWLIYKIACKRMRETGAALVSALYLLCPMIILDSAVWGQTDSVFTVFMLLMCYLISEKKLIPSYFVFAIGILIKPQSLFFTPVLICGIIDQVFLEDFNWKKFFKNGIINRKAVRSYGDEMVDQYQVLCKSQDVSIDSLSGGNIQKVVVAREWNNKPKLMIAEQPTRGIDIGAKAEIQQVVLDLASQGMGVVFISSELEEVVRLSDDIEVLKDRHKIAEIENDDTVSQATIVETIANTNVNTGKEA